MLDANMKQQLSQYLGMLREPIELVASLGDDAKSAETRELLETISGLSDKVTATFDGDDDRKPSFVIRRASDASIWVRFAGVPLGHEFTSLVLALLWAGGHPPKVDADLLEQVRGLEDDFNFEMYFSLSCHNCPDVVQALTLMAMYNPHVNATLIEGGAFKDEVEKRGVMAVPAVFLDGEMWGSGKMDVAEILGKLDTGASAKAAVPPGPRPRSTPRARASRPASLQSAWAVRCRTPWASRTSSRSPTPKVPSWPRRWNSTSASTRSTR